MIDSSEFPCPNCQIGICQPKKTTYLTIYDGMLVSVPNTPVWQCDICQYQEFEHQAISRLETLLGLQDSQPEQTRSAVKVAPIEPTEATTVRRIKP
ncbi:MAG: YgiT-type zinc finger protein [Chloroflexi bacterium]|nr:YgiT-type zinc finger protein [Chloroflexota bacterium]